MLVLNQARTSFGEKDATVDGKRENSQQVSKK